MDLAALTLGDFEPLLGDTFAIAEPVELELVLGSATTLGATPGGRDPFTLVFRGPAEPILPQATYRLEHAELRALEIFVVPIGREADGTSYEAIFT